MPIPIILGGLAIAAGTLGFGAALNAKDTLKDAERICKNIEQVTKQAEQRREKHRQLTEKSVEALGKEKKAILDGNMKMFVRVFSRLKNVNFKNSIGMEELADFALQSKNFDSLELSTLDTADITAGLGVSAVAATALLSSFVAGPAMMITGFYMDSQADKKLAEVKTYHEKARVFVEESNNVCELLKAIQTRAEQIDGALAELDRKFGSSIRTMVQIIARKGVDWNKIPVQDQKRIGEAALLAKTVKAIVDTPLLHEDGTLNEDTEQMLNNVPLLKG